MEGQFAEMHKRMDGTQNIRKILRKVDGCQDDIVQLRRLVSKAMKGKSKVCMYNIVYKLLGKCIAP